MFLQKNALRQKLEAFLEGLIVRRASAIITVTPESQLVYRERYTYLGAPGKFYLIPNGCDLDEYDPLSLRERKISSCRFLVLSAAWGFRKDYRDITPFLLGLDKFLARFPEARREVEVVLLGDSLSREYDPLLADLNLNGVVHPAGAVKRNEFVEWLWKADLFLLIQPIYNTTAISGTLYEYWATGKAPVLLISEEGASSALVKENHIGEHFLFNQIEQIADYIEKIYAAYHSGKPVWIERGNIQRFDRRNQAQSMQAIWREALGHQEA